MKDLTYCSIMKKTLTGKLTAQRIFNHVANNMLVQGKLPYKTWYSGLKTRREKIVVDSNDNRSVLGFLLHDKELKHNHRLVKLLNSLESSEKYNHNNLKKMLPARLTKHVKLIQRLIETIDDPSQKTLIETRVRLDDVADEFDLTTKWILTEKLVFKTRAQNKKLRLTPMIQQASQSQTSKKLDEARSLRSGRSSPFDSKEKVINGKR